LNNRSKHNYSKYATEMKQYEIILASKIIIHQLIAQARKTEN